MEKQAFEYMSYHFIPVRQFNKKEDFFTVTRRLKSDLELGFFDDDYYGKGAEKRHTPIKIFMRLLQIRNVIFFNAWKMVSCMSLAHMNYSSIRKLG